MNSDAIPQNQVFAMIGQQHVELVVLRERVAILQAHQCAPCKNDCCNEPPADEATE